VAFDEGREANSKVPRNNPRAISGLLKTRSHVNSDDCWIFFVNRERMAYSVSRGTVHLHSARAGSFC
jgi:hypothetical protein